jgi:hypothetical protein
MKIEINEYIPHIAYKEAEKRMDEWNEIINDETNFEMAAHIYGDTPYAEFTRLIKAEVTAKRGGWEITRELDMYIEMECRTDDCITEAGFYVLDMWQSTGDNRDELRTFAYIRNYRLEK